ncbi:MAG TPA: enoyl-CoA hydratase/isomerase family protein [Solirubrobacterales bacterium]|jgi:enoyl-CoA hydratase/carnithine racemase|nr:enoyl-CoA hydratase/isomerase family protein [Solirubrobacterales bacterium]
MRLLEDYVDKCKVAKVERDDAGILEVRLHTDGGELRFGSDYQTPYQLSDLFSDIADDPENKVVLLTGTGETFCDNVESGLQAAHGVPMMWDKVMRSRTRMLRNLLEIEAPIVAAINGPARAHAEVPVLCDIVLAAESTYFQDAPHFPLGGTPGDGAHILWPYLLGPVRGKYMLLTGEKIHAEEAKRLGIVNEVLPADKLQARARELAEMIAARPPLSVRYTRQVLNLGLKRLFAEDLQHGLALEGLAAIQIRGWRMHNGGSVPAEEEWGDPLWLSRPEVAEGDS